MNLIFMISLWCIDWVGSFMWTAFLFFIFFFCIKNYIGTLAGLQNALTSTPPPPPTHPPPAVVYSTDRSKALVPVLVLLFVLLRFILLGDLFYVSSCVILFLCFLVLLAFRLPRLGKRELVLVLFVPLFDLRLFRVVCFLFLLVSGKSCGLWLWHSLDFTLTHCFFYKKKRHTHWFCHLLLSGFSSLTCNLLSHKFPFS